MTDTEQPIPSTPTEDDDIEAIIEKLDENKIEADREIGEDDDGDEKDEKDPKDQKDQKEDTSKPPPSQPPPNPVSPTGKEADKKKKNPFNFLKRLSSKDKSEKEKEERIKRKEKLEKVLSNVKVDTLPQTFVTKYLGNQPSKGLYGIKYTREPVETMVGRISSSKKGSDMPLFSVQVSTRGLLLAPHKANKAKEIPIDMGLLPIEFISYGVQDVKYTRIFSYIVVREMSSKSKVLECHALLCDSVVTARRLALSMAMAFKEYARSLQGRPYKFKVDLRAPQEVEKDLEEVEEKAAAGEEDCEA